MQLRVPVLLLGFALSAPALAYLDPVTGNLLVQAVLAGAAAVALFYHRLKTYFASLFGKKKQEAPKEDGTEKKSTSSEDQAGQEETDPKQSD